MGDIGVQVDDQVQLAEFRGTVRYIGPHTELSLPPQLLSGPLKDQEGIWVGVDWEDVFRGKHDGRLKGVRYFETLNGGASGSFLPAEKFRTGCSLVTALQERYGKEDYDEEDMFVSTTNNKSKRIELVGLTKIETYQKNTQQLKTVDLSGASISHTGSPEEMRVLLGNLQDLDLSFNFVRDWQTVVDVVTALPQLAILNLSGNTFLRKEPDLKPPKAEAEQLSVGLRTLIVSKCHINWEQAVVVASWLHQLRELQVCANAISTLSTLPGQRLVNLEVVDFSFNRLQKWADLDCLSQLPLLKKLILTGNPLSCVSFNSDQPNYFQSLESLLLGDCSIDHWDSVTALNLFPSLKESRLTGNPLMQNVVGGGRFEIVARVGGLVQLNGSRVSERERIDCERRYVSYVANYLLQNDLDLPTVTQMHPRYPELVAKHGEHTTNAAVAKQTGALRESVVEVNLICHAPSAGAKMGEHKKKVSLNMSLGTLKILIEKLFTVPKDQMKLFLKVDQSAFPEDITDIKDDKRLGDLYIVDGQEILINE